MSNFKVLSNSQDVSMANDWFELANPQHFWIKWRFQVLKNILLPYAYEKTRILEIGCGNGLVMRQLYEELDIISDGCDLNLFALNHRLPAPGQYYLYDIFDQNPTLLEQYDIILMLDVLEHIEDDKAFIQAAMKHLKKGGLMVVGVPAYQSLFSKYDEIIGHKRRYTGKQLQHVLETAGMENCNFSYWGFSLLPVTFIRKYILRFVASNNIVKMGFNPPHPVINQFFILLMRIETGIFKKVFAGTSIMIWGTKS